MDSDCELQARMAMEDEVAPESYYLQKFKLYETQSVILSENFYMIGADKSRTYWRVIKIGRLDPNELIIHEDPTIYSEAECYDLLGRVHEGNKPSGGLKFVTTCYGIIGFVKFLGPYYMLLITKRKKIGAIGSHAVYTVAKSAMIPLSNSTVWSNVVYSKNEKRYKKILAAVDLTKDFFFSYSYHVMRSLQKNLCEGLTGQVLYEKMFVWNEFLTRGIRHQLKNTLWTVALAYGFFKQVDVITVFTILVLFFLHGDGTVLGFIILSFIFDLEWNTFHCHGFDGPGCCREKVVQLSVSGRHFKLTLIARRSRHFAGTRYLKRGVNEKGRVANDVESEQIVFEDVPQECSVPMSSIVQNRVSKKDQNYEATRLHFQNLVERYGNPIIILNLIKTREKKPRESILCAEFAKVIDFINQSLSVKNRLKFVHWDLHKHSRRGTNVLALLGKVAENALSVTGFLYCQVTPELRPNVPSRLTYQEHSADDLYEQNYSEEEVDVSNISEAESGELDDNDDGVVDNGSHSVKPPSAGHQLHALGFIDDPKMDLDSPLADELMRFYEIMGDTLALQYGGSAAHNKIFCERRGQWKAATHSQEFFRTLQRYYSNAYMDAEKQDAINLFLGHFQPQQDKPALWELDSDQHYNIGRRDLPFGEEKNRSTFKRSLSDGNILSEADTPMSTMSIGMKKFSNSIVPGKSHGGRIGISESSPDVSTNENGISYGRYTPSMTCRQLFTNTQSNPIYLNGNVVDCSNFLDMDRLSSSGNSCEEDPYDRSAIISSPAAVSSENVMSGISLETDLPPGENGSSLEGDMKEESKLLNEDEQKSVNEYSEAFRLWVSDGETFYF
ncbi:hypothetical protein Syun_026648 [Stephania yunnanensis]|uniref:SAC domain-containing protein n=1 Tax=Stephania yunnanensis TaxID=152371 RepID=A0AAP0EZH2_9MAGN